MREYKRLTKSKNSKSSTIADNVLDCVLRLQELEDKIENGTLIKMPRIIHPNKIEWYVQYQYPSGIIDYKICFSQEQAEEKIKELKGKE